MLQIPGCASQRLYVPPYIRIGYSCCLHGSTIATSVWMCYSYCLFALG